MHGNGHGGALNRLQTMLSYDSSRGALAGTRTTYMGRLLP
jgi:hypothetical protein